jgi:hypothetical protein
MWPTREVAQLLPSDAPLPTTTVGGASTTPIFLIYRSPMAPMHLRAEPTGGEQ